MITIKVKIDTSFEIDSNPNLTDWVEATDEQKNEYVKTQVRDFLLESIDEIIEYLMNDSKIEF